MALPRQAQEAIARAEQIAREAGMTGVEPAPAQQQPAPPPQVSAPTNEPQPPQQPANDQPQDDGKPINWEQRYKVLEGKYKAEVPRMAAELRETNQQLTQLTQTVQALSEVPRAPTGQGSYDPNDPNLAIAPETRDEYGEEFFDVVQRTARQVMAPMVNELTTAMEELRRGLVGTSQSVQQFSHRDFLSELDKRMNSWRTLNVDAGFKAWVEEAYPLSGIARKHLLADAVEARDVSRAVAFFQSYENEHGEPSPPAARRPAQRADTSLEALAAPGHGRPGQQAPAPNDVASEIWTRAEIRSFYTDVRAGKFKGREAEQNAFEQRIVRAAADNRVTGV